MITLAKRYRSILWVGLGIALVIFYTTFITARTYYNPNATAVILILGSTFILAKTSPKCSTSRGNTQRERRPLLMALYS